MKGLKFWRIGVISNCLALLLGCMSAVAQMPKDKVIFYYAKDNKTGGATVRLDRIEPLSAGVKAILAMYAFQNASDCGNYQASYLCALTDALKVGGQCSDEHVELVRHWFQAEMPRMSGYNPNYYKNLSAVQDLKSLCYKNPDTASFQQRWDLIRISIAENKVHVYANGTSMAREDFATFRYETYYEILPDSIRIVSHNDISPTIK